MTESGQYLRAGDIARLLGLSERTVRRRIADRTFASRKVGGARLVAKAELESPAPQVTEEVTGEDDE